MHWPWPDQASLQAIEAGLVAVQAQGVSLGAKLNALHASISALSAKLDAILAKEEQNMATLDDITAAVAAEKTVEDSVVMLLQQLSAQLQAAMASNDPAAMQAIVDQLNSDAQTMADAVTANTPPAPTPAPTP